MILLFHDDPEVIFLGDRLVAHGSAANDTGVIVFISIRQNEEEAFFYGNGSSAFGAVELRSIEISVCRPFHKSSSGISSAFANQTAASLSLGAL
jgi:hypothetical protein